MEPASPGPGSSAGAEARRAGGGGSGPGSGRSGKGARGPGPGSGLGPGPGSGLGPGPGPGSGLGPGPGGRAPGWGPGGWGAELPRDLVKAVLEKLDPPSLLCAGAVCREWGEVAEEVFREICTRRDWRLPRRPRAASVPQGPLQWRGLFVSKTCRICCGTGEFGVRRRKRRSQSLVLAYFMCEKCVLSKRALGFYRRHALEIDLIGASGLQLHDLKARHLFK